MKFSTNLIKTQIPQSQVSRLFFIDKLKTQRYDITRFFERRCITKMNLIIQRIYLFYVFIKNLNF